MGKVKVFSAPEHIKKPVIDFSNYDSVKHQEQEQSNKKKKKIKSKSKNYNINNQAKT